MHYGLKGDHHASRSEGWRTSGPPQYRLHHVDGICVPSRIDGRKRSKGCIGRRRAQGRQTSVKQSLVGPTFTSGKNEAVFALQPSTSANRCPARNPNRTVRARPCALLRPENNKRGAFGTALDPHVVGSSSGKAFSLWYARRDRRRQQLPWPSLFRALFQPDRAIPSLGALFAAPNR